MNGITVFRGEKLLAPTHDVVGARPDCTLDDEIRLTIFAQPGEIVYAPFHVSHLSLHGGWGDDAALQLS